MRYAFPPTKSGLCCLRWQRTRHSRPQSLRGRAFFQETAPNTLPSLAYFTCLFFLSLILLSPSGSPPPRFPREGCDLRVNKDSIRTHLPLLCLVKVLRFQGWDKVATSQRIQITLSKFHKSFSSGEGSPVHGPLYSHRCRTQWGGGKAQRMGREERKVSPWDVMPQSQGSHRSSCAVWEEGHFDDG